MTRRAAPVPRDPLEALPDALCECIEATVAADRPDLLGRLLDGLQDILRHPTPLPVPSREDPDGD